MAKISPIRPSRKPVLKELQLCKWLDGAAPGDTLEYYRGFLAKDVWKGPGQRMKEGERLVLDRLASRTRWAAERGFAHLVQRRIAPEQFSYLLIARPRAPTAPSPLACIDLAAAA